MPLPDATLPSAPPLTASAPAIRNRVNGWGGGPGALVTLHRPDAGEAVRVLLEHWRGRAGADFTGGGGSPAQRSGRGVYGAIARGMGRSYGDAAQLEGGRVLDTTRLSGLGLNREQGTVRAGAGVTLGQLLDALVPAGWMVPVLPGTQHVTVGGAIASDIHGKNHGVAGTFGSHVRSLSLATAAGDVLELGPDRDGELFAATVGGMGLTGVITEATIKLRAASGPWLAVDSDRVDGLDEALAALQAPGGPHRVAWLDLLGSRPARGIVTRADHLDVSPPSSRSSRGGATVTANATVPARWPGRVLRASTVRAFNELWFRRAPKRQRAHPQTIGTHMFPLDALNAWPRLYGRGGFVQYQLVVPFGEDRVLHQVINRARRARVPCCLAVLKDFGPPNDFPLSFPIAGWTLALDFPRAAVGLEALLDGFDELVAQAGGRVYLTKDARLRREVVEAMYPRLAQWRGIRDRADPEGLWRSDLALRTGLIDESR
jgi:decaprenylphospho-beta-D-ribofuranose 2-oxidase